jgi:hypothetical protein
MSTTTSVKSIKAESPGQTKVEALEAPLSDPTSAILNSRLFAGDFRVSPVLQSLLDEYKAQTLKVDSVKEDLKNLHENPELYFENRKRFLFHSYTQSLDQFKVPMAFDIMVLLSYRIILTERLMRFTLPTTRTFARFMVTFTKPIIGK